MVLWMKHFLEYLGGAQDAPPVGLRMNLGSVWWGIWWGILLLAIVMFCGQSSKFIYIDF
jgi:hypothetical protein